MKAQNAMLSAGLFILRLAILILIIVGIYRVGETAYLYCYSIVADTAVDRSPGKDVSVVLDSGMTAKDTARLLEKKGLVKDAEIFRIQLKLFKYEDKLRTGSYMLNTSMTPKTIMAVLAGESEGITDE